MSEGIETTTATATTTETAAPAATESTSANTSAAPAGNASTEGGAGGQEGAQTATAPQTYTPNFKFKVHDKEHEIDPLFRDLIKDADTEKKIREMHERAFGLDHVKTDRTKLREQVQQVTQAKTQQDQALSLLGGYLQKKDFDSFFEHTKVSEDDVLRWAIKVAERRQNPQLQAQHQQERQASTQMQQLQAQNQSLLQNYEQVALQAREFELNQLLGKSDVMQAAQAFEARVGRPGAFKEEVAKRGFLHWKTTGRDVTAEQAVSEVMNLLGITAQAPAAQVAQLAQAGTQAKAPEGKPVIPNIQGRGTSPVAKVPSSVAELRAMARSRGA